ncbi:hypothetical protein LRS05_05925 [Flavobacterium sp. J372]|uniref:hypothetical protein n=1 Tax=Flavobacterium sp. J372 TaxID=2898436 RepID=UPI00215083DF|nr:hypothetical protein [Flavobacterium sp. J372]MCR5861700.1 hypothetical protein [Flavobacterium sp. J372]
MKLAIHKSNWGFSPHWIEYCEKKGIPFKIVDCYKSDIIEQVEDCDVLLWHHHHTLAKDKLFAQQLLFALEHSGKEYGLNLIQAGTLMIKWHKSIYWKR